MAIRAGSGGLKYPVASRAQLQARQNAASAGAGGSASSAAFGANRRFAGLKRQIASREQQNEIDRGFTAGQNALQRQNSLNIQNLISERQNDQQEFTAEQAVLNKAFQQTQAETLFNRQQQLADTRFKRDVQLDDTQFKRDTQLTQNKFDLDVELKRLQQDLQVQRGIQTGALELSPDAEREMKKLEVARSKLPELDGPQQAEALQKIEEKERRIRQTARAPQGAARINRGTVHVDTDENSPTRGTAFNKPGPGRTPVNPEFGDLFAEKEEKDKPKGHPLREQAGGGGGGDGTGGDQTVSELNSPYGRGWTGEGFSREEAKQWNDKFNYPEARAWKESGFTAEVAKGFASEGVSIENAMSWINRLDGEKTTPENALKDFMAYVNSTPGSDFKLSDGKTYSTNAKELPPGLPEGAKWFDNRGTIILPNGKKVRAKD